MLTYQFYRKDAQGTMTHTMHCEIMNVSGFSFCDLH